MRLVFTEAQNKFRREVREFVESELEAGNIKPDIAGLVGGPNLEFSKKIAEKGWIGMTWPEKYGGQERTYVEKMIMLEEMMRVKAPIGYHFSADRQVGPALMKFGTEWQKDHFLPRIIQAADGVQFCLLFSEPDAGSDLAAVTTTARKDGDFYVIDGQKVWTSAGHVADFGWLLARTNQDSTVRGHMACSEFILDMKAPGVSVRPINNIAGAHSFNEVFLDNVKVHKKYLVGTENEGFRQIMAQMDFERAGIERLMQNYPLFLSLIDHLKNLEKAEKEKLFYIWVRDQIAQLEIEFQIGKLMCYNTAWMVDQGQIPSSQAAMTKAYCTQYEQRLNDVATKILGPVSLLKEGTDGVLFDGFLATCYLWGPSYTLQGGSVEVLKNIVAQRGLGLPRR